MPGTTCVRRPAYGPQRRSDAMSYRLSIRRLLVLVGCPAILALGLVPCAAAGEHLGYTASIAPPAMFERWILTSLYSHSWLSGNRDSWNEGGFELLYRVDPRLIVGGAVDLRQRSQDTDKLYSASFSYLSSPALEWHGVATFGQNVHFSARQAYTAGLEWRAQPRLSLLFDYKQLHFAEGTIHEYKPGITYWFSDDTYLTGRYAYGQAYGETSFDAYSVRLNLGFSDHRRMTLGFAHGTDPEKAPGLPGVILTSADTYSIYSRQPLHGNLDIIVGAEYERREDIYSRSTVSIGFSARF